MDQSKVQEWIDLCLPRLQRDLCLWQWDVEAVAVDHQVGKTGNSDGDCNYQLPYMTARIQVCGHKANHGWQVVKLVRHELIHLYFAEEEVLFNMAHVHMEQPAFAMYERMQTLTVEHYVLAVERALDFNRVSHVPSGEDELRAWCQEANGSGPTV